MKEADFIELLEEKFGDLYKELEASTKVYVTSFNRILNKILQFPRDNFDELQFDDLDIIFYPRRECERSYVLPIYINKLELKIHCEEEEALASILINDVFVGNLGFVCNIESPDFNVVFFSTNKSTNSEVFLDFCWSIYSEETLIPKIIGLIVSAATLVTYEDSQEIYSALDPIFITL